MQQAGAAAAPARQRILAQIPPGLDDRAPVFIGSREDVALAERLVAELG
jgi:fructose-1,6-bisphosphatase I